MHKTATDKFWDERPNLTKDPKKVNIDDIPQRALETDFLLKHLDDDAEVLEVGCGNGFLTSTLRQHVKHIDGFDYAENMVKQAKEVYGERNNRFFHDNLLEPQNIDKQYDAVVCVRVLINLADFNQQEIAFSNLCSWVKPGGKLLLVEGFADGFNHLNEIRERSQLKALSPAAINYYSNLSDFKALINESMEIKDTMHTGSYDFLTRVVYPALVGSENATGPSDFHEKILEIAKQYNPEFMSDLARLHGWSLIKK